MQLSNFSQVLMMHLQHQLSENHPSKLKLESISICCLLSKRAVPSTQEEHVIASEIIRHISREYTVQIMRWYTIQQKKMSPGDQPACQNMLVISMLNGADKFEEMIYIIFKENKVKATN